MKAPAQALIAALVLASCGAAQTTRTRIETVVDVAFVAFKAVTVAYEAVRPSINDEYLIARIDSHLAQAARTLDLALDAKQLKDDKLVVQAVACGAQELTKTVDLAAPLSGLGKPVQDRVAALVREVGDKCELY